MVGFATTNVFGDLMRTDTFPYDHFTWATNVHFLHYAGSWAVPVRWDLSDEDLEELLDSINGIMLGGGAAPLVDHETGEHSYFYKTARRIWNYMKRQKDEKGIDWPIVGICQGFEVIHYLANEDAKDTLSRVEIYSQSRPLDFVVDEPGKYTLFEPFPDELLEKLETEDINLHAHTWAIKTDTYAERAPLRDFFDILATDEENGEEFVVAVEGKHYPVTGVMFHPETQNRHVLFTGQEGAKVGGIAGKVNNEVTDQVNFYFSEHVRRQAAKTLDTHKFADPEFGMRMEWLNSYTGLTRAGSDTYTVSYGV